MGIARSTFYDLPPAVHDDTAIVEAIAAICTSSNSMAGDTSSSDRRIRWAIRRRRGGSWRRSEVRS